MFMRHKIITLLLIFLCTLSFWGCKPDFDTIVAEMNAECPMDCGEGLTMSAIFVEDSSVVVTCMMDESQLGGYTAAEMFRITDSLGGMGYFKDQIKQGLQSEGTDVFIELMKDKQFHLVYRMVGTPSGSQYDILFTPEELY